MEELEALLGGSLTTETQAATEGESKKKKKKKAGEAETKPAAEDVKQEEKTEQPVVELTPEQKEAAIKEALKKRTAGGAQ